MKGQTELEHSDPVEDVATGLIWIEEKLDRKDLTPTTRTELETLRIKALAGQLRESELNRRRGEDKASKQKQKSMASFLSSMRTLRRRGIELVDMPTEAMAHLDSAISIIKNQLAERSGA